MNKKLHILIATRWYAPVKNPRSFRTIELVREICSRGCNIDLFLPQGSKIQYCSNINYYHIIYPEVKNKCNKIQLNEHVSLKIRIIGSIKKILRYLIGDSPRNFLYGIYLLKDLCKISKKNQYDMILAISYPFYVLLAVAIFRHFFYEKQSIFVADCGDPFYYNPANPKAFYLKYLEKFVLRQFDYIAIPEPAAICAYKNYNLNNLIKIIPQGVTIIDINENLYKKHEIPVFCYSGVFYESIRNPEYFFEYLSKLSIDFRFIVYGLPDPFTMKILKKYKSILKEKLIIKQPIDRYDLIYVMSRMDFVVNFSNDNSTQIPSKLIDYAMCKRPILSFNKKTFSPVVFEDFLHGVYSEKLQIDLQKYDIKNVVNLFLALIKE